eukprot:747319-Pleurochrysis_carterae.AAC.1
MLVSSEAAGVSVMAEAAVVPATPSAASVARQNGDFCNLRTGVDISNSGTEGNAIGVCIIVGCGVGS